MIKILHSCPVQMTTMDVIVSNLIRGLFNNILDYPMIDKNSKLSKRYTNRQKVSSIHVVCL